MSNFYVYRFLDNDENIIYIGKTIDLENRITGHFQSGHLPETCYQNVKVIQYISLSSRAEMDIYEIYLINIYSPVYNTAHNYSDDFSFVLPKVNWNDYEEFCPISVCPDTVLITSEGTVKRDLFDKLLSESIRVSARIKDLFLVDIEEECPYNKEVLRNINRIKLELRCLENFEDKDYYKKQLKSLQESTELI